MGQQLSLWWQFLKQKQDLLTLKFSIKQTHAFLLWPSLLLISRISSNSKFTNRTSHTHTQTNTNTYTTKPFLPHNIQEWLTNKIISFVFSLSSQIIIYPDKVSLYPACIPPENSNGQNWSAVMFHNKKYSRWWLKCYNNLNHLLNYNRKTVFWFEGNILRFFENCLSVDRWEESSMGFRDENLGLSPDLLAIHFGVKHSEPQKSSPVKWG